VLHALRGILLGLCMPGFAGALPFEEEVFELLKKAEISKASHAQEAKALHAKAQAIIEENLKKPQEGCLSKPMPSEHSSIASKKASHPLVIFVSLSMPEASLQSLYQEALEKGAVLVLRGLQDDSFKKTGATLQRLGIALQIDPTLFKRYEVQQVPTFIGLYPEAVHRLSGHVSLAYVIEQFEGRS
jgi:type-F conjugative transfer system pilin assembly protein TrbC